jgi:hypothetical protein
MIRAKERQAMQGSSAFLRGFVKIGLLGRWSAAESFGDLSGQVSDVDGLDVNRSFGALRTWVCIATALLRPIS